MSNVRYIYFELNIHCWEVLPNNDMQERWSDSIGSVEEMQAKVLKRQEAAAKRERAMAYALTHQVTLHDNIYQKCLSSLRNIGAYKVKLAWG